METFVGVIFGALLVFYLLGKNESKKEKEQEESFVIKPTIIINKTSVTEEEYEPPPVEYYWKEPGWVKVSARLEITYNDRSGQESQRSINITGYDGSAYLNGFCEMRQETRTFRIDRIKEAIDQETGELIESVPDYLLEKYKQSPEHKISKVFENHIDIIKVLLHIGKADGQLRAEEKEIICSVIRSISKDKQLPENEIIKFLTKMEVPSLHSFKLAFGRVCKTYPNHTPKIYDIAKKIIDTQKAIHANEQEALDYMIKKMKQEGIEL